MVRRSAARGRDRLTLRSSAARRAALTPRSILCSSRVGLRAEGASVSYMFALDRVGERAERASAREATAESACARDIISSCLRSASSSTSLHRAALCERTPPEMLDQGQKTATPSPPSGPERVGRYELVERIGDGGMAEVHLARRLGVLPFQRPIAVVKKIHAHAGPQPAVHRPPARRGAGVGAHQAPARDRHVRRRRLARRLLHRHRAPERPAAVRACSRAPRRRDRTRHRALPRRLLDRAHHRGRGRRAARGPRAAQPDRPPDRDGAPRRHAEEHHRALRRQREAASTSASRGRGRRCRSEIARPATWRPSRWTAAPSTGARTSSRSAW